ncbi:MAG: hypothetical protein K2W96_28695, partial [Gemmataceae bacterium]|nr:hypothetical protein [Gemmataceae bacterium]
MNAEPVVIGGTVRADGTLELDGKVPLPAGRVSVALRQVPAAQKASLGFLAALREIQDLRESYGVKADADSALAAAQKVRDEFDEQVE